MFFRKKKKELPELPELESQLPALPAVPDKLPELGKPIETQPSSLISEIERYKNLEVPELEEKKPLELKKESFVKIEHYSDIVNTINIIKDMLSETTESISRLVEIKNLKETHLDNWQNSLQNINKKLNEIDNTLFEKVI